MNSTKKTNCIIILGMHRSGTSCLAGALQQAGLYLGNVSEHNKFNKKGNREHLDIMRLNDEILHYNKASWDKPPTKAIKWTDKHKQSALSIINRLKEGSNTDFWGFKDPRTLLTISFWNTVLTNPTFIGTFRHPLQVVQSLQKRGENAPNKKNALELWYEYNQQLLKLYKQKPFKLISFDMEGKKYIQAIQDLSTQLKLPGSKNSNFFEQHLRTNSPNHELENLSIEHIFNTYKKLQNYMAKY